MSACAATGASTTRRPEPGSLEARLAPLLAAAQPVAVAYSGGRDSTALLHAAVRVAAARGAALHALHVHHGLSPQADAWLAHCAAQCAALDVPLHAARVQLSRAAGEGVEAEARRLRYQALSRLARDAGCRRVLLAHHADDQAETLLLQALRGGGIAGLAAMPARARRGGIEWLRPWLGEPRSALQAYLAQDALPHVEDDSNADPRYARNRLRHRVMPALEAAFPGAVGALSQVAQQVQEALACLDELATADLAAVRAAAGGLHLPRWYTLSPPRRNLVLRAWLKAALGAPAPRSLVERLMAQLRPGLPPHRWPAPNGFVAVYRDVLHVAPAPAADDGAVGVTPAAIMRTGRFPVPFGASVLEVVPAAAGVPLPRLVQLTWRPRTGGEQFQASAGGVPRSLKKAFQSAGVAAWLRQAPLLYAGDSLLFVPALGLDARHRIGEGDDLVSLRWLPAGPEERPRGRGAPSLPPAEDQETWDGPAFP